MDFLIHGSVFQRKGKKLLAVQKRDNFSELRNVHDKILLSRFRYCYSLEGTPVCTKLVQHITVRQDRLDLGSCAFKTCEHVSFTFLS